MYSTEPSDLAVLMTITWHDWSQTWLHTYKTTSQCSSLIQILIIPLECVYRNNYALVVYRIPILDKHEHDTRDAKSHRSKRTEVLVTLRPRAQSISTVCGGAESDEVVVEDAAGAAKAEDVEAEDLEAEDVGAEDVVVLAGIDEDLDVDDTGTG